MSFGGSVAGMLTALKDNKSLLGKAKKNGFKANNRIGIYSGKKGKKLEFKEVSEEELEIIKLKIRKKILKDKRINNLILTFSIVIGFPLFIYLIRLIFNN